MNLLILTSNTGGGHIKAAEALSENLKNKNSNFNIKIINTLEHINPSFNKLVTSFYNECVKILPEAFGKLYYYSETDHVPITVFNSILKSLSKKLIPIIKDFNTDIIISTHPFSTQMICDIKETNIVPMPLINLITDYAPHKFWIYKNVDSYAVASKDMIDEMVERGVDKNIINPTGIPVSPDFLETYNKNDILKELRFSDNTFSILLMCGSIGVNYVLKILKMLMTIENKFQIIIITGKNTLLRDKINRILMNYKNGNITFKILGFTNQVARYMSISDIIITKPGGLTTTESIFSSLPILFFNAIPGQEEKNGDFITRNMIGKKIDSSKKSSQFIKELINDDKLLLEFKKNMSQIKNLNFIEDFIELLNSYKK